MPVTLGNSGVRAWDPSRIHLSYHWLWLVPRELAHRSRTVPYHDGIRTDLGGAGGAGGQRRRSQGRILAPAMPGLYWLQWDMVEEGVTWFAQVAPRQPRTLVVVVPPLAWICRAAAAAASRCGACSRLRRSRGDRAWSVRSADVWWCAATLAAKPLILAHAALLEPTVVAYWLIVAVAVIVPVLGLLLLPRRAAAVGAAGGRHLLFAADPGRRRLLPLLRRRPVDAGAAGGASDRPRVGIGRQPVHARAGVAARRLAVRLLARGTDVAREAAPAASSPRSSRRTSAAAARGAVGGRRGRGGSARARVHAARSDVPRALGRRTTRTVRLPRLRHVELRAQHAGCAGRRRRRKSTRRPPGFANARRCEPAGSASARRAAGI